MEAGDSMAVSSTQKGCEHHWGVAAGVNKPALPKGEDTGPVLHTF